jgi:hypothetical protein
MTDLAELRMKFDGERQRYTVWAHNKRFAIMTKPFNARKTYLYTITDLERGVRGPCNFIFGLPCDVDTPEGAAEAMKRLVAGEMEVSYRRSKDLSTGETATLSALIAQAKP